MCSPYHDHYHDHYDYDHNDNDHNHDDEDNDDDIAHHLPHPGVPEAYPSIITIKLHSFKPFIYCLLTPSVHAYY